MLLFAVSQSAQAVTVQYDYSGEMLSSCDLGALACNNIITASIQLTDPGPNAPLQALTPDFWSISDGLTTIDETSGFNINFSLRTDANSDIDAWNFIVFADTQILNGFSSMRTTHQSDNGTFDDTRYCTALSGTCSITVAQNSSPGSWTLATPIPGAVWLFGSGLLGLIGISRCR